MKQFLPHFSCKTCLWMPLSCMEDFPVEMNLPFFFCVCLFTFVVFILLFFQIFRSCSITYHYHIKIFQLLCLFVLRNEVSSSCWKCSTKSPNYHAILHTLHVKTQFIFFLFYQCYQITKSHLLTTILVKSSSNFPWQELSWHQRHTNHILKIVIQKFLVTDMVKFKKKKRLLLLQFCSKSCFLQRFVNCFDYELPRKTWDCQHLAKQTCFCFQKISKSTEIFTFSLTVVTVH